MNPAHYIHRYPLTISIIPSFGMVIALGCAIRYSVDYVPCVVFSAYETG